ncbi:hypothetical protein F4806DRAFT_476427 [Annulohypoxylon nitens]|nr:hypothetical protein F4806DRAFT_476427 [Annulohypoxylon nitens]
MQFTVLSLTLLSALLSTTSAATLPTTALSTTSSAPEAPTQAPGVIDKDVVIKCADVLHWLTFYNCMKDNANPQCIPVTDEPSKHMCRQLWEITCGMYKTCTWDLGA